MSKIGLSNIRISTLDGKEVKPIPKVEATLTYAEEENYKWLEDINKPIEATFELRGKRKGSLIEK